MAKNKAQLQDDCEKYRQAAEKARKAHLEARFMDALEMSVSSFEFIDGMMQFEKRFEKRTDRKSVECIDYVLEYAPSLLDLSSLENVSALLKSQKRIDKNTSKDEAESLSKACALLWRSHRLCDHLEKQSEVLQDRLQSELGGDQETWRRLAEKWEDMGFIERLPEHGSYRLVLVTRLDAEARGKCPSCGATGKATKERLLDQITCPKCHQVVHFIVLAGKNC